MQQAIGVVETCGMPGALVIADVMAKGADVRVVRLENTDAGRITVIIRGVTGAVQAAIAAAYSAANQPGVALIGHHIVPCPDDMVEPIGQPSHRRNLSHNINSVEWLDD